jgi:hypothetical protein
MPAQAGAMASPQSKPRWRWLAIIAAFIAILYLLGVTGRWWPSDDSAVYLGLGRSLAQGNGYTVNGQVNTAFSPGLPLLLAGLEKLVGERGIWVPNLFMALCGLCAISLVYLTLRRITGDGLVSAAVAAATALSYPFYLDSHRVLSDIPFAAAFWLLLYVVTRWPRGAWTYLLIGALSVANVLVRVPGVLVLGPLALGLLLEKARGPAPISHDNQTRGQTREQAPISNDEIGASLLLRRRRLGMATVVLAPAAATLAGLWLLARQATQAVPHYAQLVTVHSGPFAYVWRLLHGLAALPAAVAQTIIGQPFWYVGLVLMALAVVGIVSFWASRRPFLQRVVPVVAIMYPLLLALCLSSFGMRSRYLAPIEPLIVLLVAEGLGWCVNWIAAGRGKILLVAQRAAVVPGLAVVIILVNLPHVARNAVYYSYRSHGDDFYTVIREGRYAELAQVARLLRLQSPADAWVAAPQDDAPALYYLSGRFVLEIGDATPFPSSSSADSVGNRVASPISQHARPQYMVERISYVKDAPPTQNPSSMPNRKELFRGRDYVAWEVP